MEEVSKIYECAHCSGTGTCTSAKEGSSCDHCIKKAELKSKEPLFGIACGTCWGIGKTDSATSRLRHRTPPILAIAIIFASFLTIIIFGSTNNAHFPETLSLLGALMGSVITFYFTKTGGK
ncbi:MAG: molecular chaperone DnaJ [Neptuniibacter sp.]